MTELEKMQRAKMYMDKLANGIDPISDTEMPEDDTLNNVRLSRCFFYVSDILRQAIEKQSKPKPAKRPKRVAFHLTAKEIKSFSCSKTPLRISEFVSQINALIDTESMRRLPTTAITGWMLEKGFLEIHEYPNGKKARLPIKQGEYIGLSTERRSGQYGEYQTTLYNEAAQRFVMDNLEGILSER